MCTEKNLYSPADNCFSPMPPSGKKRKKVHFSEISFVTDCIRKLALKRNTSIAETIDVLKDSSLFPKLYKLMKQEPKLTQQQVANRMYKLMENL